MHATKRATGLTFRDQLWVKLLKGVDAPWICPSPFPAKASALNGCRDVGCWRGPANGFFVPVVDLTRRMLDALAISEQDRVVELAPGLGITARMVLRENPMQYCAVERDPADKSCRRG